MKETDRNTLVSIVIPVYNGEVYLRDAIQSVVNQTFQNWKLYLINDGSTDGSLVIMEEYALRDARIKVIDDGQNKGLVTRLNQSVEIAVGKYYARMDADDIMYITRIEEQVTFLESHPDVDVLGTSIMIIDNNNDIVGSDMYTGEVNSFIHPTVMGKLEWFRSNPYCEWALRAEDMELWSRTASKSKFWALNKPLLFYRELGVPIVKKYIQTQKTLLRICFRYKRYEKSCFWFMKNSVYAIIKIIAYMVFDLFGRTDILISKRRRIPLTEATCLSKEDLIKSISSK